MLGPESGVCKPPQAIGCKADCNDDQHPLADAVADEGEGALGTRRFTQEDHQNGNGDVQQPAGNEADAGQNGENGFLTHTRPPQRASERAAVARVPVRRLRSRARLGGCRSAGSCRAPA